MIPAIKRPFRTPMICLRNPRRRHLNPEPPNSSSRCQRIHYSSYKCLPSRHSALFHPEPSLFRTSLVPKLPHRRSPPPAQSPHYSVNTHTPTPDLAYPYGGDCNANTNSQTGFYFADTSAAYPGNPSQRQKSPIPLACNPSLSLPPRLPGVGRARNTSATQVARSTSVFCSEFQKHLHRRSSPIHRTKPRKSVEIPLHQNLPLKERIKSPPNEILT
ncbi:uncharacterized protein K444DRAFT_426368 [Hyaloscypha bicolor E]|uniref:Uncharacterized protein n=1 Tax=Hyaloscypha bicolor E TaxID=1095630 RepID=A0A2J6T828_9HELO|nr:uncharacterized protein K444DRAFT_426368 [Hyaloscypha bicolor E]PMD59175.1 hypothetical protein K444DRAFT_426368 [Hyaloscypha bicolor E]